MCVCVLQGVSGEPGSRGKMGRPVKFCLNILYRYIIIIDIYIYIIIVIIIIIIIIIDKPF